MSTQQPAWHYSRNGTQHGPVSPQELRSLASSGGLLPTDLVWKQGLPEWVPAEKINGLFASPADPPPLPTPPATPPGEVDSSLSAQFSSLRDQFRSAVARGSIGNTASGSPTPSSTDVIQSIKADPKKFVTAGIGCGGLILIVMCCGVVGSVFTPPRKPSIQSLRDKDPSDLTYSEKQRLDEFDRDVAMKSFEKMAREMDDY